MVASGSKPAPAKIDMERGRDGLAERLTKHGNVSSEKAHQIAANTVRDLERKKAR